jgi:predicted neuraminidase
MSGIISILKSINPPRKEPGMNNQQETFRYGKEISQLPACDVVVTGGGIAGVFAALAAARLGANTVLIEQHSFVGGQGTAGGVHTFCGETRLVNNAWAEMIDRLRQYAAIADYRPNHDGRLFDIEMLKFVLQEMLSEAGVRLLLHTQLVDVERHDEEVAALIVFNKSDLQRLVCRQVIDATGDADVVARGCWPFEKGGPVFLPTGELHISPEAGHLQLPMSLYFTLVKTGQPATPVLPEGSPTYEADDDLPMITVHHHENLIVVKMKVIGHDATDGESLSSAEQAARRQMMAVIYHLQTRGYKDRRYPDFKLAWVAPHIGIREGRRIIAQYRLTADDVLNGRHFGDAVAVGSYHVDYHWPTVVQRAGTGLTTQSPPYQIPLRAMRPAGSKNLLVPGRSMSGEQMAMSSFRVMGTCAQTGFAAGTAAALAVQHDQSLDEVPIQRIQSRLRADGVRLDLAPYTNYLRVRRTVHQPVFEPTGQFQECHASTLAQLPSGDVVCAWFGGTTEGADDVDIWLAIRHEEVWSQPTKVVDVPGIPTWNPVLFMPDAARIFADGSQVEESDTPPRLLLYYRVGKKITEWQSFVTESLDGGHSWSDPQPLPAGCLGPIKNKPIVLADGTWLAGSSVETEDEWYCQIERSEDGDASWQVAQIIKLEGHPKGIIQPTLWESRPGHVHAFMRSRGVGRICRSDSTDGGRTWSVAYKTELPNNNSGIDVTRIVPSPGDPGYAGHDEEYVPLVLAFNPVTAEDWGKRTPLILAVSYDNGQTWPDQMTVQDLPGEYSYPAIIPTADGVAMTYTFDRRHIQFARYSLEHLSNGNIDVFAHIGDHAEYPEWIQLLSQANTENR